MLLLRWLKVHGQIGCLVACSLAGVWAVLNTGSSSLGTSGRGGSVACCPPWTALKTGSYRCPCGPVPLAMPKLRMGGGGEARARRMKAGSLSGKARQAMLAAHRRRPSAPQLQSSSSSSRRASGHARRQPFRDDAQERCPPSAAPRAAAAPQRQSQAALPPPPPPPYL